VSILNTYHACLIDFRCAKSSAVAAIAEYSSVPNEVQTRPSLSLNQTYKGHLGRKQCKNIPKSIRPRYFHFVPPKEFTRTSIRQYVPIESFMRSYSLVSETIQIRFVQRHNGIGRSLCAFYCKPDRVYVTAATIHYMRTILPFSPN